MGLKQSAVGLALSCLSLGVYSSEIDLSQVNKALRSHACLACHDLVKKRVGPAYQVIAQKYRHDQENRALLVERIQEGSSGVWGPLVMPPQRYIKPEQMNLIVDWLMAGAPDLD